MPEVTDRSHPMIKSPELRKQINDIESLSKIKKQIDDTVLSVRRRRSVMETKEALNDFQESRFNKTFFNSME
jgi:hypothetical protein